MSRREREWVMRKAGVVGFQRVQTVGALNIIL